MNDRQKPQNVQNKLNTQRRCVNFVNHLDRVRVLATLCPVKSKVQRTRGGDPKSDQSEPAECTDRMEWRTGRRSDGTPRRDNPQHAPRGTPVKGGARTGTGPDPPDLPRASRTQDQGTAAAKAIVAPAPRLGTLRTSPWGSHWRQASSTGPAVPASRATTHQGGGVVGKRLKPRLLSVALTGEWQNGEAGEGQGSEPREPGGPGRRCGMKCPPLGTGGEDITWPDQVASRGRRAPSTQKVKPQTSNLKPPGTAEEEGGQRQARADRGWRGRRRGQRGAYSLTRANGQGREGTSGSARGREDHRAPGREGGKRRSTGASVAATSAIGFP